MASFLPEDSPTCPVCLETPAVVKLSACEHVFCQPCISKHLKGMAPETKIIECPTCKVESTLPDDVGNKCPDTKDGAADARADSPMAGEETKEHLQCRRCKFKTSLDVKAEGMCEECGQFPLCSDCILVHSTSKATHDHIILPLKNMRKSEVRCEAHDQLKKSFCETCSKLVCHICVMIEHEDHVIKKWSEVCREITKNVVDVTAVKSAQLEDLKKREARLKEMESSTLSDERKALVKNIEEHTEKWLEETLRQKTVMIAAVSADYNVFDWSSSLNKIADAIQELEGALCEARRLVPEHISHPGDLETLFAVHKKLSSAGMAEELGQEGNKRIFDDGAQEEAYKSLQQKRPTFVPNVPKFEIGKIEYNNATGGGEPVAGIGPVTAGNRAWDITQIYYKEFRSSIISAVNYGDRYAVAYGKLGPPSQTNGFNVYDFSYKRRGSLTRDLFENLRHLAATSDGSFAGLYMLYEDTDTKSHFKIIPISTVTGTVGSPCNIRDEPIGRVWSFDVTGLGRYVILHSISRDENAETDKEDTYTRVSVYKQDGSLVLSRGVGNHLRFVSCSEKNIFVSGGHHVHAYEFDNEQLVKVATSQQFDLVSCVSAAPGGEVTVVCKKNVGWYIGRAMFHDNRFSEWQFKFVSDQQLSLVSVAGGRIVLAGDDSEGGRNKCLRIFQEF